MSIDFNPYFKEYEALLDLADKTFEKIREQYPDLVKCRLGCADCCYALFDLPLIEALYVNYHFNDTFKGGDKNAYLESVNRIDRKIHQLKRKVVKDLEGGKTEEEILNELSGVRVRCPLLNAQDRCDLYAFRPITCRLYGIPTSIGGKGRTCGLSGFKAGEPYQTVNIDVIQQKLLRLSERLARDIGSKYVRLGELLVPLSMALLTDYDETYLGVAGDEQAVPSSQAE
ncbi:MAG: YkgJ family cysteine cluster protein [Deltaproteobacteria bacterium]|nr:YkgJ family cysteine cluster protein [Deltaproteobacteria bacterium]